jgi:hypothetical protein
MTITTITEQELESEREATIRTTTLLDRACELYLCNNHNDAILKRLVLQRIENLILGVEEFEKLTNGGEQ